MAAPVVGSVGTVASAGAASNVAVPVPSGVAANDIILVHLYLEGTQTVTAPAGFTEITPAPATTRAVHISRVYWKRATGSDSGTYTFTFSSAVYRRAYAIRIVGCIATGSPVDVAAQAARSSDGFTTPAVSVTTTGTDRLLMFFGTCWSSGTWTPPAGFTERADANEMTAASRLQSAAGSSGSTTATSTNTNDQTGRLIALLPGDVFIASTDSGAGSDTADLSVTANSVETGTATDTLALTVDQSPVTDAGTATDAVALTEQRTLTDSALGTDALDVTAIEYRNSDDAGLGTESIYVDIPELISQSDSGTGTDTAAYDTTSDDAFDLGTGSEIADILRRSSTTDDATGSDALAVQRASTSADTALGSETTAVTRFALVEDGGVGTDSIDDLFRRSSTTDSGLGTDTVPGVGPAFGDAGIGTDVVSVVDIPFTQILPLKSGPIYDLVVVARIPQGNGPPSFLEIDPIEWKGLTYTNTLSKPQELTASCLLSSVTEDVLQRLRRLHDLATELWLYRNGQIVFAGPLVGWQTSGEDLTLSCRGLLSYLRLMVMQTDKRYVNVDQFTIVKELVNQWQALEFGNFGIDTSSIGLSGIPREVTYTRNELKNVSTLIEEMGASANGFDVEVDPASRKLQLWAPRKGVDRSSGEDAIVIDARNVTSADILCSVAGGDLASEAYGTGTATGADKTLFSLQSNVELRARFGRCAVTQSFTGVETQAQLDANTAGLRDARTEALLVPGPRARITPDADLVDFAEGDTIAYELGSILGVSGAFRIRKQHVVVSSTGQEALDLEFV